LAHAADTEATAIGLKRTCLSRLHEARGAIWREHHGWEIPACYSNVRDEYQLLRSGCGLLDLSYRTKLRITGRDRRTWLHGQVTQDVTHLPDGRGAYATVITPQGRMVADLRVFALTEALYVDAPAGIEPPLAEYLDQFLIMERAEIEDLTDVEALLSLQGPLAADALACVFGRETAALKPWEIREEQFQNLPVLIAGADHCGEGGFDLRLPAGLAADLWAALSQCRTEFGVESVGWDALNVRRFEAGIPWWGEELDSSVVPLEARLERAIHFQKGCYVGQEIIARIEARGHVNNLLAGFRVEGDALPPRNAEIRHEGKRVGRVTSAVHSLGLDAPIALGYLRREHQEPGTRLAAVTGDREIGLVVTPLPFV
jgi:folate-binding protein YgfZ